MHLLRAPDSAQAWKMAVGTIETYGTNVKTEDGKLTREVYNLVVEIKNPGQGFPIPNSGWNLNGLQKYAQQLLDPREKGFDYDYGSRLARAGQIDIISNKLIEEPTTRRAILSTRDLAIDLTAQHTPCLQIVEFLLRDNQLNMTCFFRSHDIRDAYPANLYGLNALLEHVAKEVGTKPGSITTMSCSAHYYME